MVAISERLKVCLEHFISIVNSDALSDHTEEVPLQQWTDELGRLRVWAANIGAHQTHQSSLDYRLRDASHIKGQIVRLLERFQELLTDLEDVLEESDDDAPANGLEDFEGLEDIPERDDSITEIQEIHQCLIETINQLYQISMIIRQPAQHDRLVGTKKLDSEPFQFWAKQHTSNKYPNADELATDRISMAMARQRAILIYRERHHAKLSQGIDSEGDGRSTVLSETVATDVFQEIAGQSSDTAFDAAVSETSYGSTLLEGTGVDAPKIPPMPKKGRGQRPFECPFCFYIITARDKKAWARHIFRDLMPYVCIFPGCSTPNKLYGGRRQWNHHIQQVHAPKSGPDDTYDCPICKQGPLPTASFQRHVGQHLEELALFLLPRTELDDDEEVATDDKLNNASLDNNSVERSDEQRNDVNHTATPASDSDPGDGKIPEGPRNKSKHYTSSVGTNESDKASPGDLVSNAEHEVRASSSIGSRENEPAMNQNPPGEVSVEQKTQLEERWKELAREKEEEYDKLVKQIREEEYDKLVKQIRKEEYDKLVKQIREEKYDELERERIMKQHKETERGEHPSAMGSTNEETEDIIDQGKNDETKKEITWIKVHRMHILPETLVAFNLPWDWEEGDSNYIIIKEWVSEDVQEELFAHTRRLREGKVIEQASSSATELKVEDRNQDKIRLARRNNNKPRFRFS